MRKVILAAALMVIGGAGVAAAQAQLEAIPALKPYADKIIKGRPYKSVEQLADKNILPKDVLGATKSQLTVSSY
jgi:DNA uptake protein ComE-like DNA-binding protein